MKATLIENVQFIYELALAQLELEAFSVKYDVTNSLREFVLGEPVDIDRLVKRLAYFKSIDGHATDYSQIVKYNRTRSVNQYLTHWIYPYKGKFHPQMIRALLNIIGLKRGEVVLDPFIGSGTTAVEAQLLGIDCLGIDVSPLCVLQSRVKTHSTEVLDEIKVLTSKAVPCFASQGTRNLFFQGSDRYDYNLFLDSIEDRRVREFFIIAKLVAISDHKRRNRNLQQSFVRNLNLMLQSVEDYRQVTQRLDLELGVVRVESGDARSLLLEDETVDGIITSPPYSIALDYLANDAHAFEALGYDLEALRDQFIGARGKGTTRIELYNQDMRRSLAEMYRVLKPGRFCVIVVGNATYGGQEVKTIEFVIDSCRELGFTLVSNLNKIIFGLYNVMQTDNTLIFRKE